ncbi:MAG: transglutaminase domain-containing protein [Faecousia sp.]
MKRKMVCLFAVVSLLLTGCSWLDGNYVSVAPHREQEQSQQTGVISAANYQELLDALEELIASGTESAVINVAEYPSNMVENGVALAVRYAKGTYPMGAYAVEDIVCERGTSGGKPALAVTITYRYSWAQIRRIRKLENMEAVETAVVQALKSFDPSLVLLVETYEDRDFIQIVENYAVEHPQIVMETPQVTVNTHGGGKSRVVELIFTYQNSRDVLRQMQSQVEPVFNAASLYVSGEGADRQKFSQLYAFLMERFDYTVETSITPAYSLLRHGVGDSRAFATVYAAMCRGAGLKCQIVTGTHAGEPWTWNMVLDNGYYYHVDLLRSSEQGGYREYTDSEMRNYVWDYSAYPVCTGAVVPEDRESQSAETTVMADPEEETLPLPTMAEETVLPEETTVTEPDNILEEFKKGA